MPRYHFNIRTAQGSFIQDEDGVHLPSMEAAREEARLTAASLSVDTRLGGYDYSGCYFEIVSADGREAEIYPAFVRQLAAGWKPSARRAPTRVLSIVSAFAVVGRRRYASAIASTTSSN